MIQSERVVRLNDLTPRAGRYVLYWMQASHRAHANHALEYAIEQANSRNQPVLAVFGLTDDFPRANGRHYTFMLEGLQETQASLARQGIQLAVLHASPPDAAATLASDASLVVADCGYLRLQRQWRERLAERAACEVVEVESDVVVPVELASNKEEYSAGTLRAKIHRHLREFLVPLDESRPRRDSLGLKIPSLPLADLDAVLSTLKIDRSVPPAPAFPGGYAHASARLDDFIAHRLRDYAELRSDPSLDCVSHMSPYLHFGQISPVEIALRVRQARRASKESKDAYLEELIVRRELSMNFVYYNSGYDTFEAVPAWAQKTLLSQRPRNGVYSVREMEQAETGDEYWNAAQLEMTLTGRMHGYMRMYWGKRILEWLADPREAYALAVGLNDKYQLDGRDPNSYAGIAWCFGKHDRPWPARPSFGSIRCMKPSGLARKFNMDAYVAKVRGLRQQDEQRKKVRL